MPTTTTRSDFLQSTASYAVGFDQSQGNCVIKFETDEEFARFLSTEIAADVIALQRAEQMAPRGDALERLLQRFPAPQEWRDED